MNKGVARRDDLEEFRLNSILIQSSETDLDFYLTFLNAFSMTSHSYNSSFLYESKKMGHQENLPELLKTIKVNNFTWQDVCSGLFFRFGREH